MRPKAHISLGFLFSITILLVIPQIKISGFIILFLSTFLIDFDHYLAYICIKKDISLKKCLKWYNDRSKKEMAVTREKRNKIKSFLFIFHGFEVLLILLILSLFSRYFFFIFTGFLFHLMLDTIYQVQFIHDRVDKISLIYDYIKYKDKTKYPDSTNRS